MQPQMKAVYVMLVVSGSEPLSAITREFEHDARWNVECVQTLEAAAETLQVAHIDVVVVYLEASSSWAEPAGIRIPAPLTRT